MQKNTIIPISLLLLLSLGACEFNTAKKIQDPLKRYAKAIEYYDLGKYAKTQLLLEDAILSLRMTKEGEESLYKYAYSYFYMKDYILAGYYFRKYVEDYPKGKYTEEAQFMSAKCYFLDAPKYKLDQSATLTALQEFELFITKYPNSEKIKECNENIDELRSTLEFKSFENAKLYFDIGYFGAAAIAFQNSLKEYPDSKYKEDIYYYILLADFNYAKNSILSKQKERYLKTLSSYKKLLDKFPNTKYSKDAERIYNAAKKEIDKFEIDKISLNY
jgi:outer membrane protein assembly factor BamD